MPPMPERAESVGSEAPAAPRRSWDPAVPSREADSAPACGCHPANPAACAGELVAPACGSTLTAPPPTALQPALPPELMEDSRGSASVMHAVTSRTKPDVRSLAWLAAMERFGFRCCSPSIGGPQPRYHGAVYSCTTATLARFRHNAQVAILLSSAVLWGTSPAHGQEVDRTAAAEALFNEGIELLEAGEAAQASTKFQASQELDPGVGTLMYLAECYRRIGRNASAWSRFLQAAALARTTQQPDRAALAQARADELTSSLSRVTVRLSPLAVQVGVQVHWGGLLLQREAWGSALPVDPGNYLLEATAPGFQPFRQMVHVRGNGDGVEVQVPPLLRERSALAPNTRPTAVSQPAASEGDVAVSHRTLHPLTWGLGGLTLAGATLGTVFAVWAEHIEANALKDCEPGPRCAANELEELDRAQRRANVAYAAFATAGVSLVAATAWELYVRRSIRPNQVGGVSWQLAPSPTHPWGGTRGAQLMIQGTFE